MSMEISGVVASATLSVKKAAQGIAANQGEAKTGAQQSEGDSVVLSNQAQAQAKNNFANVKDYTKYLTEKFGCLTPGKNSCVSITDGLLRKAMTDEKTASWLERELTRAPDYVKEAQQSAIAHGATLKFVSIEFGEEYTTMCVCTVTDGGGTDPEIDKWLANLQKKKEEAKAADKNAGQKAQGASISGTATLSAKEFTLKIQGKSVQDALGQFDQELAKNGAAAPAADDDAATLTEWLQQGEAAAKPGAPGVDLQA